MHEDERSVLIMLCDDIEATGGVVNLLHDDGSNPVWAPFADTSWSDLGNTYAAACRVLDREMMIHDDSGDVDDNPPPEEGRSCQRSFREDMYDIMFGGQE